jgi:hypothetical protein
MASVDWDKLEREAEMGRRVLAYLNRLELRRQEDRQYVERLSMGRELMDRWRGGPRDKPHDCSIPLSRALVCVDCWQVGIIASRCTTCGSTACMLLSNWLVKEER